MLKQQASLEVRDLDDTGYLPGVIEALLEDISTVDISIMEECDDRYLLGIHYDDVVDVQDAACAITMLCMSMEIYSFSIHYMGKEGGVVQW